MFEKEAEEYAKQNNPAEYGVRATHFTVLNSFKDGAEYGYNKANEEIEVLKKALELYVNWADECDISWDNFPDMEEKWYKKVEEKGLSWIDGLIFMVTEEAKEQLLKETKR